MADASWIACSRAVIQGSPGWMLSLSNQTLSPLRRRISANSWAAAVSTPAWLRKTWPSRSLAIRLVTLAHPIDQSQDRADGGSDFLQDFLPQTLRVRLRGQVAASARIAPR